MNAATLMALFIEQQIKLGGPYKDWVKANWRDIVNLDPKLVEDCWTYQETIYKR